MLVKEMKGKRTMFDSYDDIKKRIAEKPTWWDVHGVPRYGDIPEDMRPFVRRIKCQGCGRVFKVALVGNVYKNYGDETFDFVSVLWDVEIEGEREPALYKPVYREPEAIPEDWHYGDPPAHDCVGDSMNSIPEYAWDNKGQQS